MNWSQNNTDTLKRIKNKFAFGTKIFENFSQKGKSLVGHATRGLLGRELGVKVAWRVYRELRVVFYSPPSIF
jgi:hypothetical protein